MAQRERVLLASAAGVIVDYTAASPCVWFGRRKYPLWWYIKEGQMWIKEWAALGALDYAIDHDVPQIVDLYLGHMAVGPRPYLVSSFAHMDLRNRASLVRRQKPSR